MKNELKNEEGIKMDFDNARTENDRSLMKKKSHIIIAVIVIMVLIFAGVLIKGKLQASNAKVNYDGASKTLFIYGQDDTNVKIPSSINEADYVDADFDTFHLKLNLSLLDNKDNLEKFIPKYLGRLDQSLKYIRKTLAENSNHEGLAEKLDKKVDVIIMSIDDYSWSENDDSIELKIGDAYWHHGQLYVISIIGSSIVQWKQLGYSWYIDECINPYCEAAPKVFTQEYLEKLMYYDIYLRGGGTTEATTDNFKIFNDAISYKCLTEGLYWGGAPCEDMPVKVESLYNAPTKISDPGDDMSVFMAVSFLSYLSDKYGLDKVTAFCFSDMSFNQAFGSDFQTEYDSWSEWILAKYGE